MSKKEYADHRGCSKANISKLIKQNKIILEYGDKIDPEKTDARLPPPKNAPTPQTENTPDTEQKVAPKKTNPQDISLSEVMEISAQEILISETLFKAQQYKEIYNALSKKAEYEKTMDKLRSKEETDEIFFNTGRLIRDFLTSVPDRLAPLIASETDLHVCSQILKAEINGLLETISNVFS